jgi:hypothetical protein
MYHRGIFKEEEDMSHIKLYIYIYIILTCIYIHYIGERKKQSQRIKEESHRDF